MHKQNRGRAILRLNNIDLNLLLTLELLLENRSVSTVARRMGASQPTVSRSLGRLREIFEDPLLIRTNHGMELTRRAEELIEPLRQWLETTEQLFADQEFDPSKLERQFRIAATDSGVAAVLSEAFPLLRARAPGVSLIVKAYSDNIVADLSSGASDLAITGFSPDESATYQRRLLKESNVCIVHADHPLAGTEGALSLDDYLAWPHVSILVGAHGHDPINGMLGRQAAQRHVVASIPYFCVAPSMLAGSDAILTLPAQVAASFTGHADLVRLTPPVEIPSYDYWLLWHERSRRDPATQWLIDLIADACARARE